MCQGHATRSVPLCLFETGKARTLRLLHQRPAQVLIGNRSYRQWPFDPQFRIIIPEPSRKLRSVKFAHLVKDLGTVLQSLETMRKHAGDIESQTISRGQLNGDM